MTLHVLFQLLEDPYYCGFSARVTNFAQRKQQEIITSSSSASTSSTSKQFQQNAPILKKVNSKGSPKHGLFSRAFSHEDQLVMDKQLGKQAEKVKKRDKSKDKEKDIKSRSSDETTDYSADNNGSGNDIYGIHNRMILCANKGMFNAYQKRNRRGEMIGEWE